MSVLLSVSAPVSFSVLLLLDAPHGSLAEIELTRADLPVGTRSHWLWIEERTVTELRAIGTGTPSRKAFDRAVLALDGERAELIWPSGLCDALKVDPGRMLRPEFLRLVHQHVN